jgi:hypothetical protein
MASALLTASGVLGLQNVQADSNHAHVHVAIIMGHRHTAEKGEWCRLWQDWQHPF